MFPRIENRKVWFAVAASLVLGAFHLFDKWDELLAGENYIPALLVLLVPAVAIYLVINISALQQNRADPRTEGTKK